jgi:hypothetical protein
MLSLRTFYRNHAETPHPGAVPFPIAHAHKKLLACLDDDTQKLKCLLQTAETVIQFLALAVLAQLAHDLQHRQAPALGSRGQQLRDELRSPSFGKWQGLLRDLLKQYRAQRHLLVVPELFDFYFQPSRGATLPVQPVVRQAIDPLITLRNHFHHPGIPDPQVPSRIAEGLKWLEQLLAGVHFLSTYYLAFVQEIKVRRQAEELRRFSHDLVQMRGCFTIFDRQRWDSDLDLHHERVILLAPGAKGRYLVLDPFLTVADQLPVPGVLDVFLLNGAESRRARYLSAQFGQELPTDHATWPKGAAHLEALGQFFDLLRRAPAEGEEVALADDDRAPPGPEEGRAERTTEEVYQRRYQHTAEAPTPVNPYKFLNYYGPEDAALFFGRDQEIRQLQRKFHSARLLILHGESGTGKTSLIRAGLLPRLSPESYVPVYVRALQEPTQAIKEAMVHQLGVDRRNLEQSLAAFLAAETAHLSKTVVLILDQFEEFFLRLPLKVRQRFHQELGACLTVSALDVRILITLRDDNFAHLAEFQDAIPDIFTHEMHLTRLTPGQALAAVVEPAKRVGLTMDETLVSKVLLPQLDEAGQDIAPPLLQIVCDALYQQAMNAGRTAIGAEEYAAIGDVRDALGRYLETTLRQFGPVQPQARAVLKALVTAEGTKRASFIEELVSRLHTMGLEMTATTLERDFLRRLLQARLVRGEDVNGRTRYELTHDYLAQQIGAWIAASERELTKVLELIDRAYEAYQATGLLLEPGALAMIASFADELVLPAEKHQFLEVSQQTARRRRRGLLLKIGALLLVVGLGVGGFFGVQLYWSYSQLQESNQRLEAEKRDAKQRLVALYTEQGRQELLQRRWMPAAVYLSEAYQVGETSAVLRFLLAQAIQGVGAQLASLEGHAEEVFSAQFSPDGSRLLTASWGDTAKVWDVSPETRSPVEIAALVRCRVLWRLDEGRLLPATPDPTACPPRSAAQ